MEDKTYWKCDYTYEEEGKVKTTEYKSPTQFDNSINPNMILKILAKEINNETGRSVKNFIRLVNIIENIQCDDIKIKNLIRNAEVIYNVAITEDEIKEVKQNEDSIKDYISDLFLEFLKETKRI